MKAWNKRDAQDRENQNWRSLRVHFLAVEPELGVAGSVRLRGSLVHRELGIKCQEEDEERKRHDENFNLLRRWRHHEWLRAGPCSLYLRFPSAVSHLELWANFDLTISSVSPPRPQLIMRIGFG